MLLEVYMLNALKNLAARTSSVSFPGAASTIAGATGAFIGQSVGGAYTSMFTRGVANYAIPRATASSLLQVPLVWTQNIARDALIERLGYSAYSIGTAGGGIVGSTIGMAALQISCKAGGYAYNTVCEKWDEHNRKQEAHQRITGEYNNLPQDVLENEQVDGLEVEDDFVHLSRRVNSNTNAYSLVNFAYNRTNQNSNRFPLTDRAQNVNRPELMASPLRLTY